MSDIPEDIEANAENCIPVGLDGNHYRSTLRQYIAAALLAERERATQAERDRINAMWDRGNAAAIRTPSTGEEQ